MKHTHYSERDAAWFDEVADTIARGRTALLVPSEPVGAALSLIAATDAGASGEDAVLWLLSQETQPDVDATALALIALARSGNAARARCHATIHSAINFLLAVQNRDGGWPGFDRHVKSDPSCPAITAHVLEALGHFGFRVGQPPVDAAVKFVLSRQEESGAWLNRGGTNELQTTWQVIAGLRAVGSDVYTLPVRRSVRWLKESQREDAGWGGSTPTETAWALLSLLAAGDGEGAEVRAGAEFLVGTQHADGTWSEGAFAGTDFALMALGRYLSDRSRPAEVRKVLVRTDAGYRASRPKSYRHTLAEM